MGFFLVVYFSLRFALMGQIAVGGNQYYALGFDPEHAVFDSRTIRVVDQRDLGLRIRGQGLIDVPGGHPKRGVFPVALDPGVKVPIVSRRASR